MTRSIHRLSARKVETASEPGLIADGGGLYLQVSRQSRKDTENAKPARSWIFRFMLNGRSREMGLGALHTVSLAEARDEAERCRKLLRDGIDPIEERKLTRGQRLLEAVKSKTFKECAEAYIAAHKAGWKNPKHASQWSTTLEAYAYPKLGALPVQSIDATLVHDVLEPIWSTKTETASRLRGRIEAILDWAGARKYRSGDNPARWKGHLDKLFPAPSKVRAVKHLAALPYGEIGTFVAALREQEGVSARGLEFLILTAARTGEVMGATWEEFDLDNKIWTVPAERMKGKREHRVPLSKEAVAIVEGLRDGAHSDYVFPGAKPKRPLSNMAFLQLLKRMERGDLTAHGFRSTFRDWASEQTGFPREVAEMALAHAVGDKVEAAYRRGDLFEKRRKLMTAWASYCGTVPQQKGDNVVQIAGAR